MHIYFREKETGRFITHFTISQEEWDLIKSAAHEKEMTPEEFIMWSIKQIITDET